MGDLLTTKVKLRSRWSVRRVCSLAFCFLSTILTGCTSGTDSRASYWEQLWLDGSDALAEDRLVDARRLLELAVAEARSSRNGELRVGITLDRLGDAYALSQMTGDAEKKYLEAIDAFDSCLKNDKDETEKTIVLKEQIGTFNALSAIWLQHNKYKKAEEILDRAVANAKLVGAHDAKSTPDMLVLTEFGSCLEKLSFIYENTNRKDKAATTHVKASKFMPDLALKDDISSPFRGAEDKPERGTSPDQTARLNNMIRAWNPIFQEGTRASEEGDTEAAKSSFKKAYRMARAYSESSEPTIDSLTQLVKVTNKLHEYTDSEKLYFQNEAVLMRGTPTKSIDNALGEIAKTFTRQKRWSDAEKIYVRRVKVREFLRGPTNMHVAETLDDLANVYIEMKHNKQAELVLQKALKITDSGDQQDSELASKIALRLSTLKEVEK